jgi:hypothetical protein
MKFLIPTKGLIPSMRFFYFKQGAFNFEHAWNKKLEVVA